MEAKRVWDWRGAGDEIFGRKKLIFSFLFAWFLFITLGISSVGAVGEDVNESYAYQRMLADPSVVVLDVRTAGEYNNYNEPWDPEGNVSDSWYVQDEWQNTGHMIWTDSNGVPRRTINVPSHSYIDGSFVWNPNWNASIQQLLDADVISKDTEIYVHCRSGGRSRRATDDLVSKGFTNVYNMNGDAVGGPGQGSMLSWSILGYPKSTNQTTNPDHSAPPNVLLFTPKDGKNFTHNEVSFNFTIYEPLNVTGINYLNLSNVTLYVWDSNGSVVVEETNSSGLISQHTAGSSMNTIYYTIAKQFTPGTYTWNVRAIDEDGDTGWALPYGSNISAGNRSFTVSYGTGDNVLETYAYQRVTTNPNAVILDVRSTEEYNNYDAWGSNAGNVQDEINNSGHMIWTDSNGIPRRSISLPYWTDVPGWPEVVVNPNWDADIQELLDAGVISKETEIYVHCRSGYRSRQATDSLVSKGFTNVYNMNGDAVGGPGQGSMLSWSLLGLPKSTNQNETPDHSAPPNVLLFSPNDGKNFTHNEVSFNFTIYEHINVTGINYLNLSNVTLYVWDSNGSVVVEETNSSGLISQHTAGSSMNTIYYTIAKQFTPGTYTWNVRAIDEDGDTGWALPYGSNISAGNRSFTKVPETVSIPSQPAGTTSSSGLVSTGVGAYEWMFTTSGTTIPVGLTVESNSTPLPGVSDLSGVGGAISDIYYNITVNNTAWYNQISNVQVKLYYSDADIPSDVSESTLRPLRYTDGEWVRLDCSALGGCPATLGDGTVLYSSGVDASSNYVWANLSRFSVYGIGGTVTAREAPAVGGVYSPEVTVLANSIDLGLAGEFIDHLEAQGIDVTLTTAEDFSDYNKEQYIIVLGGHQAYEGVGEIAGNILTEEEEAEILQGMVFLKKKSLFRTGGITYIFAGMDRDATAEAWKENYEEVAEEIKYNWG